MLEFKGGEANFVSDDLTIDFANREVSLRGEIVKLTPTEYKLLHLLVRNRGQVVTHRKLMHRV